MILLHILAIANMGIPAQITAMEQADVHSSGKTSANDIPVQQDDETENLITQTKAERASILRDTNTLILEEKRLSMNELLRRSQALFVRRQQFEIICAKLAEQIRQENMRSASTGDPGACTPLPR